MPDPATRSACRHFVAFPTRWMDNDLCGDLNNVVHYSLFDTAMSTTLIAAAEHFAGVHADRVTRRPVALPDERRVFFEGLTPNLSPRA